MKNLWTKMAGCLLMTFSLISCGRTKYFAPLGSFTPEMVAALEKKAGIVAKNYFTSNSMQSGELFKIVDSNASFYLNGKKIPFYAVAEKAKFFVINIGLADVFPSMKVNPSKNEVDFDIDLVNKQLEILEYHLYHTLDMIRGINAKSPILMLGSFNEFYNFQTPEKLLYSSIISKINKTILSAGADHKTRYISLLNIEEKVDEKIKTTLPDLMADIIGGYL